MVEKNGVVHLFWATFRCEPKEAGDQLDPLIDERVRGNDIVATDSAISCIPEDGLVLLSAHYCFDYGREYDLIEPTKSKNGLGPSSQ